MTATYEGKIVSIDTIQHWRPLIEHYGESWCIDILASITADDTQHHRSRHSAFYDIDQLVAVLCADSPYTNVAKWLLDYQYQVLCGDTEGSTYTSRYVPDTEIAVRKITELLCAIMLANHRPLFDAVVDTLIASPEVYPPLLLVETYQRCFDHSRDGNWPIYSLQRHILKHLRDEYTAGGPDKINWSVKSTPGCSCEDCTTLATFLSNTKTRQVELAINDQRRRHLIKVVTKQKIPVETHIDKSGRPPYQLVIIKSADIQKAAKRRFDSIEAAITAVDTCSA